MSRLLNREEVELQLQAKTDSIAQRIDAIQAEITTTGDSIRDAVIGDPVKTVGIAVGAGLVVGLLFGGSGGSKKDDAPSQKYRALIDEYIESIAEETRRKTMKGKDAADAVKVALKDRVPVIVYNSEAGHKEDGFFGEALDLVWKTALGFGVKFAIDFATARFGLTDIAEAVRSDGGADSGAPIAAMMSELD